MKFLEKHAEKYMIAFALSDEVRELLRHLENSALLERAQDFAAVRGSFEGFSAGAETLRDA